ncbi:MAG: hypothetical protein O3B84_04545 [Chloroflexi bacterium]|nr:hypothetical protein [Chloroflexota bacterium]
MVEFRLVEGFRGFRSEVDDPDEAACRMVMALKVKMTDDQPFDDDSAKDVIGFLTMALQTYWNVPDGHALRLYGEMIAAIRGV